MVEPTFCSLTRRVFGSDLEWFKRHILLAGQAESRTVFISTQSSLQYFCGCWAHVTRYLLCLRTHRIQLRARSPMRPQWHSHLSGGEAPVNGVRAHTESRARLVVTVRS